MPKFTVRRRVDAFIDYTTEVEAANPEEAALLARSRADALTWKGEGQHEFDAEAFVTLDATGREVPESECGDF